jgi:hypothetical protein
VSYQQMLPEDGPGHKPGSIRRNPAQCRPRPSAADLQARVAPADIDPGSPSPKVFDYTTVRFRAGATERQIARYFSRRRHLFGWRPYRNAPPT